jgi:hypothetical protein
MCRKRAKAATTSIQHSYRDTWSWMFTTNGISKGGDRSQYHGEWRAHMRNLRAWGWNHQLAKTITRPR